MIVFDASAVVSAALREDSVPARALLHAEQTDICALSAAVNEEIGEVMNRPRFAKTITPARREQILATLPDAAAWFDPAEHVADCRDAKDNKYLELALSSGAATIVSGVLDLLVLHPWGGVRILRPADYLMEARRDA